MGIRPETGDGDPRLIRVGTMRRGRIHRDDLPGHLRDLRRTDPPGVDHLARPQRPLDLVQGILGVEFLAARDGSPRTAGTISARKAGARLASFLYVDSWVRTTRPRGSDLRGANGSAVPLISRVAFGFLS